MASFDNWAHRQIKKSQYAKKKASERKETKNQNLGRQWSKSAVWAAQNPSLAAYDNDGNPVPPTHWAD